MIPTDKDWRESRPRRGRMSFVGVQDRIWPSVDDLRLRRLLCGKAAPFRRRRFSPTSFVPRGRLCLPCGTNEELRGQISRKGGAFSHSEGRSQTQKPAHPLSWTIVNTLWPAFLAPVANDRRPPSRHPISTLTWPHGHPHGANVRLRGRTSKSTGWEQTPLSDSDLGVPDPPPSDLFFIHLLGYAKY